MGVFCKKINKIASCCCNVEGDRERKKEGKKEYYFSVQL